MFVSRVQMIQSQKISIPIPYKVAGNSLEVGFSNTKILKLKYEAKLEFPVGWGI